MSTLTQALQRHAARTPHAIALHDSGQQLGYRELDARVQALAAHFDARRPRVIGLLADNGCDWAVADLAACRARIPLVPLPLFFSAQQLAATIRNAGIDLIVTDRPTAVAQFAWIRYAANPVCTDLHDVWLRTDSAATLPAGIDKITYTSGSTGAPKGVCLDRDTLETVAAQLCAASGAGAADRHLCMLPLSTLLENVGGLYAGLLAGATICLPDAAELGMAGSSELYPAQLLAALRRWQPTTGILVPQLLQALVALARNGATPPRTLRYLAVGGAPVAVATLRAARDFGLPVYEGYGLSECASVVALNRPGDERPGSVGRPLPHVRLSFADDGEISVHGVQWHGYLGDPRDTRSPQALPPTGDIGYLDVDGFLFITGRKKSQFSTAFGRNVAPEWVERELVAQAPIQQAAVFGEGRARNCAVIVAAAAAGDACIDAAMRRANAMLPDYARIGLWLRAAEPFSTRNAQATANGRLCRDHILTRYADDIDALYADTGADIARARNGDFLSAAAAGERR